MRLFWHISEMQTVFSAINRCALSLVLGYSLVAVGAVPAPPPESIPIEKSLPSRFDPKRDAEEDFRIAVQLAASTHRLVLMYVGGDWCESCRELDRFFADNPDLAARRDEAFVFLRVNYSAGNKNRKLLSRMPFFLGYPHWFLIDEAGRSVHSSFAASNRGEFEQFLAEWGRRPPAAVSSASCRRVFLSRCLTNQE